MLQNINKDSEDMMHMWSSWESKIRGAKKPKICKNERANEMSKLHWN